MARGSSKQYKLSLLVTANTASATAQIGRLENKLKNLATKGGFGGATANIGANILGGLRGAVGTAGGLLSGLLGIATKVTGGIVAGFKLATRFISGTFSFAIRGATKLLKYLGVAAGGAAAAIYGLVKALTPAGRVQQFRIQLEVLLGSVTKATERLRYLREFAATTPFQLPGVIEAANLMQAFEIYSKRAFTAAGDAAATFGKSITEVIRSLGYLSTGRTGEAFESLARIGVTRGKLQERFGVQFSASGELQSSTQEALVGVIRYFETEMGGMMKRQSRTFFGALSNLKDAVWNAFADAGKRIVGYAANAARMISEAVEKVGEWVGKFDWSIIGKKIELGAATLLGTLRQLLDPSGRQELIGSFKSAFGEIVSQLGKLPKAFARDLGSTFGNILGNFNEWGRWLLTGLAGAFRYGASLFAEVMTGMAEGTKERLILKGPGPQSSRKAVEILQRSAGGRAALNNYLGGVDVTTGGRDTSAKTFDEVNDRLVRQFMDQGKSHADAWQAIQDMAHAESLRQQRAAGNLKTATYEYSDLQSWLKAGAKLTTDTVDVSRTTKVIKDIGGAAMQPVDEMRRRGRMELMSRRAQQPGFVRDWVKDIYGGGRQGRAMYDRLTGGNWRDYLGAAYARHGGAIYSAPEWARAAASERTLDKPMQVLRERLTADVLKAVKARGVTRSEEAAGRGVVRGVWTSTEKKELAEVRGKLDGIVDSFSRLDKGNLGRALLDFPGGSLKDYRDLYRDVKTRSEDRTPQQSNDKKTESNALGQAISVQEAQAQETRVMGSVLSRIEEKMNASVDLLTNILGALEGIA